MDTLDRADWRRSKHLLSGGRSWPVRPLWREADVDHTDLQTVIQDLLAGEYSNPIGVFGFNAFEGWSRDVSHDVAQELRRRCDLQLRDVPGNIVDFVERHENSGGRQLALRLV